MAGSVLSAQQTGTNGLSRIRNKLTLYSVCSRAHRIPFFLGLRGYESVLPLETETRTHKRVLPPFRSGRGEGRDNENSRHGPTWPRPKRNTRFMFLRLRKGQRRRKRAFISFQNQFRAWNVPHSTRGKANTQPRLHSCHTPGP